MAHSDSHLTGGIMALIVMSLVFDDDDDHRPAPPPSDDDLDEGPEEKRDPKR